MDSVYDNVSGSRFFEKTNHVEKRCFSATTRCPSEIPEERPEIVVLKKTPKLEPLNKRPESYDLVVLATPVWGGSYVPAIRSFLTEYNLSGKNVILVATAAGDNAMRDVE